MPTSGKNWVQNQGIDRFLADEHFLNWAKDPTAASRFVIEKWVKLHAGQAKQIAIAREIVLRIQYKDLVSSNETDMTEVLENIGKGKRSKISGKTNVTHVSMIRRLARICRH